MRFGVVFTNMGELYSKHEYKFTSTMKSGMKFIIYFLTSTVAPLKFNNA